MSAKGINNRLVFFESLINEQTGNNSLQSTAAAWKPVIPRERLVRQRKQELQYLSFLDMELFWNTDEELTFRVHIKPNWKSSRL